MGTKERPQKPVREEQLVTQAQPPGDPGQVPHEEGQNRSPEPGLCVASPWGSGRGGAGGRACGGRASQGRGHPAASWPGVWEVISFSCVSAEFLHLPTKDVTSCINPHFFNGSQL